MSKQRKTQQERFDNSEVFYGAFVPIRYAVVLFFETAIVVFGIISLSCLRLSPKLIVPFIIVMSLVITTTSILAVENVYICRYVKRLCGQIMDLMRRQKERPLNLQAQTRLSPEVRARYLLPLAVCTLFFFVGSVMRDWKIIAPSAFSWIVIVILSEENVYFAQCMKSVAHALRFTKSDRHKTRKAKHYDVEELESSQDQGVAILLTNAKMFAHENNIATYDAKKLQHLLVTFDSLDPASQSNLRSLSRHLALTIRDIRAVETEGLTVTARANLIELFALARDVIDRIYDDSEHEKARRLDEASIVGLNAARDRFGSLS